MSSIVRVKIGEVLPIQLQAFDGNVNLFPQVVLKDESGTTILGSPFNLVHVGLGLYQNRAVQMTVNTIIVAIFKVYQDSGHTLLDPNYQDNIDVFIQENIILVPTGVIDGTMVGVVNHDQDLVGVAPKETDKLAGYVEDDSLVGMYFDEDPLVGNLDNDSLVGIAL